MTDYTQATDFSAKDGLTTGDAEKAISGADVDGEFSLISTAIASKQNDIGTGVAGDSLHYTGSAWAAVGGSWEWVDTYAASGDATIEFYHDGIENTGADMIADWDYMIDVSEWYASVDDRRLDFQAYQGAAYVTASSYSRSYSGVAGADASTVLAGGDTSTQGYGFAVAGGVTGNRGHGALTLTNAASASIPMTMLSHSFSYVSAGYAGYMLGTRISGVTKHIKLFATSGATITAGTFRLFRRYAA